MKTIGITGGIGAGKSMVLAVLRDDYHAYVLEADRIAHRLMEPEQPVYREILAAFHEDILCQDGTIDRQKLGNFVFGNAEALQSLNRIVHPAVKQYILEEQERHRQGKCTEYFVIEAALLIEDGYASVCDELWYVYAPPELRIERLIKNRGYSREKCEQIIRNQAADDYYRSHCRRLIRNCTSPEDVQKQIEGLLKNRSDCGKI